MTVRLSKLSKKVKELYENQNKQRTDWADWLYPNHVLIVEKYARELAHSNHSNDELVRAAALLHDIADSVTPRDNPNHEAMTFEIATNLLKETGFSVKEIRIIVEDALCFHSCYGDEKPQTIEGKILATADALAHLQTDFYLFAASELGKTQSLTEIKQWVLKKINRDFSKKILLDNVRNDAKKSYDLLLELFSR